MDLYKYLLTKLNVKVVKSYFNTYDLEFDGEYLCKVKANSSFKELYDYYRITSEFFKNKARIKLGELLCKFPKELKSFEHVDSLLKLNGF